MRGQPAAYWLTGTQADRVVHHVERREAEALSDLLRNEAKEVPDGEEINAALYGELIPFLECVANVPFPRGPKPIGHRPRTSIGLDLYWAGGLCCLLNHNETSQASSALGTFMKSATDEILSDPDCEYLTLFSNEPKAVREGITHLLKAFAIPVGYDATMLVMR